MESTLFPIDEITLSLHYVMYRLLIRTYVCLPTNNRPLKKNQGTHVLWVYGTKAETVAQLLTYPVKR